MSIGRVIDERYSKRYGKEFHDVTNGKYPTSFITLYCAFNSERPCSSKCISCFKDDARMMCQRGENDWIYIGHIYGAFCEPIGPQKPKKEGVEYGGPGGNPHSR